MDLKKLFLKECDKCQIQGKRSQFTEIYSSFSLLNGEGLKKELLCRDCLRESIKKIITEINWKAAFFEPLDRKGYVYYPIQTIPAFALDKRKAEIFMKTMYRLLPKDDDICEKCGHKPALISWSANDIFANENPFLWKFKTDIDIQSKVQHFCPECFSEIFLNNILSITINDIYNIIDKEGFYIAGEI